MSPASEDPAAPFAREILRRHPQIRYEHAVAAAEAAGLPGLPRAQFRAAIRELQIERAEPEAESGAESPLLAALTAAQEQCRDTERLRLALARMRAVVRAALAE